MRKTGQGVYHRHEGGKSLDACVVLYNSIRICRGTSKRIVGFAKRKDLHWCESDAGTSSAHVFCVVSPIIIHRSLL